VSDVELLLPEAPRPHHVALLRVDKRRGGSRTDEPTRGLRGCPSSVPSLQGGFADAARKVLQRVADRMLQAMAKSPGTVLDREPLEALGLRLCDMPMFMMYLQDNFYDLMSCAKSYRWQLTILYRSRT